MGRGFLIRPLEKRVNGENNFSRNGSSSIKHTHQLQILERRIPVKRLRKKEVRSGRVRPHAGARSPPNQIAYIEKVGLAPHSQRYDVFPHLSPNCFMSHTTSPGRICIASGPQRLRRLTRYTIFNVSKLTPAGAGGVFSFISSNAATTRSATTRFRYHFRLAGTMYQGACSVLVAESTSSNTSM